MLVINSGPEGSSSQQVFGQERVNNNCNIIYIIIYHPKYIIFFLQRTNQIV